ncbi:hypothetical protein [Actinoplanes sp. N902-109]|uniref:hypothetical protein n=1 Tax=Actinoplanes sp. (strain N902-109) TaxID=649831 RepID=UPI00032941F3|nr:hypothetical protein [Actinoplanes sp. N902-109]AGL16181.1 hypothetical protein L083_2671 [Actinoplanes sp. N902-109]
MRGWRLGSATVLAGAVSGALTGCSVLTGSSVTPAGSVTPVPSASVSWAPPAKVITAVTPKPRTAAPPLTITGTAWPAILASLTAYGQWLLADPNPALVGNVAAPGCATANTIVELADSLLRDKAYLKPSPVVFGPVTGPSLAPGTTLAALDGEAVLDVTVQRPAEPVMSRSGAVQIGSYDPLPAGTALQITLRQGSDAKWRFCTIDALDDSGAPDDPSVPLF